MTPKHSEVMMAHRFLAFALALTLAVPTSLPAQATSPGANANGTAVAPDLETGILQVRRGDFEEAIVTLDGVVRRLQAEKTGGRDRSRAYAYLAVAYMGLAQQEKAKEEFLEAWRADRTLSLSPKEFPPAVIDMFERTRREAEAREPGYGRPSPTPTTPSAKGGGKTLLLGAGALAVGFGAAMALKDNKAKITATPTPSPTPTPTPVDITGTWELQQSGHNAGVNASIVDANGALTATFFYPDSSVSDGTGTLAAGGAFTLHEQRRTSAAACDFAGKLDDPVSISGTETCTGAGGFAFTLLKR
jgi:hypothetical protein